jgi:UDP-N-acetylmuramate dehydrogenase
MEIKTNIFLKEHTTFRMGGEAAFFAEVTTEDELLSALEASQKEDLPVWILGGGSNTLIPSEKPIPAFVIKITIPGFDILSDTDTLTSIRVGAGENWDGFVGRTVSMNLSGLEALSAIPGTVGGTPVQNVGAYGQEVKNVISNVRVYDRREKRFLELSNEECGFVYRDSVFKHAGKDRYVITFVTFLLKKELPKVPNYPGVTAYFEEHAITSPTLSEIRTAIISIRSRKLPDPKEIASVGSFFKNPIVAKEKAEEIKTLYANAVVFPVGEEKAKIGAGWLIETLGFKGAVFGNLGFYEHNALVVVNRGGATYNELLELISMVENAAQEKFGITLEPEPIFLV